ncbi:unnamed protein product [Clonostachys byssicola]|uniref:Uncharacterized protein n=1 Tax=Clonostachys byssicola TaxID=160290 RepID=A0A9N9Y0Q8_9HYPO|nr:unnamed protein product [Clonostachys byssicola]
MSFFTTPSSDRKEDPSSNLTVDQDMGRLSTSSRESDVPPAYNDAFGGSSPYSFATTGQLQIQAVGFDYNSALIGSKMETISVDRVETGQPEYTSIRLKKSSNSCALVSASDRTQTPLISTIYRWGPGRHPRMRIFPADTTVSVEDAINADNVQCELIDVKSRSMLSRAQKFDTSFGSFEWRYGSRGERKEDHDASSLLILERTDSVASTAGSKVGKRGVRVAQLVRSDEFRTPGTTRYMGGNGGRLMMDLSLWTDDKKATAKDVEAFVVASCICMLKREADRFRDNTIAAVV